MVEKKSYFWETLAISVITVSVVAGAILFGIWLLFGRAGEVATNTSEFLTSIPLSYTIVYVGAGLMAAYLKKKKFA